MEDEHYRELSEARDQRRALWKVEMEAVLPLWKRCSYLDWCPENEYDDPTYQFYADDEWQRRRQSERERYSTAKERQAKERLVREERRLEELLDPDGVSRLQCRGTLTWLKPQPMPTAERKVRCMQRIRCRRVVSS